jgi:hypothetical protein
MNGGKMKNEIAVSCGACGKDVNIPVNAVGLQVTCPHCQESFDTTQRTCSFCHEPGHNRKSCEARKFMDGIEEEKRQRADEIARLQKRVGSHNQKVAELKLKHKIAIAEAIQKAEDDFKNKLRTDQQSFFVRHWLTAAGLCGGALSLGNNHFDLVPLPEYAVPVSLACTAGVLLFFFFWCIQAAIRKTRSAFASGKSEYAEVGD